MTTVDGPSSPGGTHPYALWDAAYVLGSLSCAERREFEVHLKGCPSCADAVTDLGGMRALLSQIDRGYVDTLDEPDGYAGLPPLRDELLATVNTRRRRSRAATWTMAVAAALAIGVFAASQSNPMVVTPAPHPGQASALTMTPKKPVPLTATVTLTRRAWGTRIEMQCTYEAGPMDVDYDGDEAGDKLAMVAVGRDGSRTQLATWTARVGMPASLGGSTSMPVDEIASVQIISADAGAVLLERDL
ncbi:zf-HC2 domain-containing protein [Mycobacterium crocinum]|uniref:Zf-HC2 domain-containing protein n=1 Tax=Mycolicibacterium crocinum TaxID=388459 RepID=A0ABY3TDM7_9MYCO|nr:zf-HC2 domain-containing protein [Mycolicibacterium crocinum]MCV7213675.1 zf-HC2 domain-containing protein [Mycolicibacterium crocinum]ULN39559.1 zf-HC2 domain-containing protein [Mycolicibacterium crocinum]